MDGVEGYVYIIKLDRAMGSDHPRGRARYYVGWALSVADRLEQHRKGRGAKMLRAANEREIPYDVILVLPGTRGLEHEIKQMHSITRFLKRMGMAA